ncbi:MAG: sialidase family protein [Bryobacterales bacterium]|nr:sialidase family protein [Bryobacterales bacterium]
MLDPRCCVMGAGLELFSRAAFSQTVQTSGTDSDATSLGCRYEVTPKNPPNDGNLFVDNSPEGRSGHLGHALVEYEDSKILPFYPNCSAEIHSPKKPSKGHSARGGMEYKRSEDGGRTWSDRNVLAYSKNLFDTEQRGNTRKKFSDFAEKSVRKYRGEIVIFFLVCDITTNVIWRQFQVPTYISSLDEGYTWSKPAALCRDRGRVYDARNYNGEILVLYFKNDNEINFLGNKPEHVYELYVSRDGGRMFVKGSELPFDTTGKSYGSMEMLDSGSIVFYIYNSNAEHTMDYVISEDAGRTWSDPRIAHFQKRIRNGHMASLNGC